MNYLLVGITLLLSLWGLLIQQTCIDSLLYIPDTLQGSGCKKS